MANYNIDVKAKVNVAQLKSSIQESLNKTTIPVKPKFTPSVDDNNIKVFRNTVATYFQKEPISIVFANPSQDNIAKILNQVNKSFIITPTLKFDTNKSSEFATQLNTIKQAIDEFGKNSKAKVSFDVDTESYKQLFQTINNIKEEQKKISNLDISLGFDQKEKERLSDEITAIYALLKGLNNLGNSISVTEPNTENLSNIKNKIQQYFQDNPITLTISQQINDVEMGSIAEKVKELLQLQSDIQEQELQKQQQFIKETSNIQQEEIDKQIEKFKALEVEYDKHLIEKRELRDKEKQESEEHMQEMILVEKKLNEEQLQNNKHLLDEKALNYLEHADQLQEISKATVEAIENNAKQSDFLSIYIQQIEQIVDAFRQGAINIEQAQYQIWEKITEAKQESIIPKEVFDNTIKLLDNLENEAEKSFDDWRKKQEKLYNDLQVSTEKQKKYDEKIWEDKAKSVQEMYDKQQISAEQYISRINSLLPEAYEKGYTGAEKYAKAVDKVEKEQNEAEQSADNLGNKVSNLGSKFDNVFNSLMRYFGVTKIFDAVQNSFSKMIQEVRDLDVELTEFSKVTDLTSEQTNKFIDDTYRLGETVARTGTEVVQATTLFKKMGYEIDESMQFAKDALMWTNVADGMVTAESAATMLISTMKAFEEQGLSSTHVIDALNEVSNNYSTSSSALSDNLSTIAATLAVSGTSFEQTVGLMTAGIEIMPDKASKVANGLKTISQRIRQIDGDTADKLDEFLGEKGISRYDSLTGQLRGTYDILGDVAGIWDKLTENERQYIGEVMAGKNQITVLNALMMNFATAINATETAMNSAGSAAKENERVLDSIQGHIQRFQSAFEELAKNLINSEIFKQIVDFGTNLIKILNTLTGNTVTLGATIASVFGIIGVQSIKKLDNAFISAQKKAEKAKEAFDYANKIDWITGTISPLTTVISTIGILTTAVTIYKQAWENAQETERKQVQESINNRNQEIDKIKQLKKLEEEYLETTDAEKKKLLYEKIHDIRVEIANLDTDGLSRQELLSGAIGKQNGLYDDQLVKIAKNNLALIRQQQILEETSKGFWGDAPIIKWFTGNLPTFRKDNVPVELDLFNEDYFNNQNYSDYINNQDISIQNKIDNLKALEDHFKGMMDTFDPGTKYYEMYRRLYDYVLVDLKQLQKENETVMVESQDIAKTVLRDLSTYTEDELESMSQLFDALSTGNVEDINKALEELREVFGEDLEDNFIQEIRENLSDPNVAQAAYDLIDTFFTLKNATEDTTYNYSEAMGEMLSIATETTNLIQQQYDILAQAVDEFAESGVITKETLQSLTENDLLQYLDLVDGQLVLNTEAFRQNEEAIMDNAAAEIDNKLEADLLTLANSKLKQSLDDIPSATNNATTGVSSLTNTVTDATAALITDASAAVQTEEAYVKLSKALGKEINTSNFDLEGYLDEAAKLIDRANQLKQNLTNFNYVANRGSSSSRSSGGGGRSSSSGTSTSRSSSSSSSSSRSDTSSSRSSEDLWKKEFEKQQKILKHYLEMEEITERQYYASLKILNDQFFKDRVEYEEEYLKYQEEIYKGEKKFVQRVFERTEAILENQLEASMITSKEYFDKLESLYTTYYTKQEDLEDRLFELKKQRYQYEKQQIQDQINLMESQMSKLLQRGEGLLKHRLAMDEITQTQYLNALEALYLSYYEDREELEEKLWEVEEGRYEERKEKLDTVISYAISVIDEEIDKLKKEKESIDEVNDSIEEQIKLQELQDNLEKARNRKIRVYRKGQGFVYEQDTQAISEAQTALDEYKRELSHKKKISMIDEEIENLEKYKEKWQSITDNYTKSQNEMVAKGVLGENARQKILEDEKSYAESLGNQYIDTKDKVSDAQTGMTSDVQEGLSAREELYTTEKLIVDSVGDQYWETRGKAKDANDAIITDLGLFIGSENDPNSLSGKIKIINDELAKIQDATLTVEINGQKYTQTVQSIEDLGLVIDGLRGKEYTQLTIEIDGEKYELSKQEIQIIHQAIDNLQGKTLIIKIDDQTKESLVDIQHTVDSLEGKILQVGIQNNISDDDIDAIQTLLNKLKNKVIKVSLQDTISDTELDDIQNDINALQGKLIQVGIDSGTYKNDLNAIQSAVNAMKGKAIPISVNDKTKTPLVDIQTAVNALKDGSIEVTANDIQTIIDDLKTAKEDIEALDGQKAELEIGWKEENGKTQLEILESSMADWQATYTTYLAEIIDKLRTLIESQKQAGSYDISGSGGNATYQSTYSYTPQLSDKVSVTKQFQEANKNNLAYLDQPFWVVGFDYNGNPQISMQGPNGSVTHAVPASALYKYGTADPSTLSYSTSSNQQPQQQSSGNNNQQSSDNNQNNQQTSSDNQQQSSSSSTNSNLKVGDTVSYRDGLYTATVTALYDDGTAQIDISGNKYYVGQNELTVISSPSSGNNNQQSSNNNQQQQEPTPANGESRETYYGWQYYDASSGQWKNYVYKSDSNYTWYENPITGDIQDKTTKGSNPAPSYPSGNDNGSTVTTPGGATLPSGGTWTESGGYYYDGILFHANGTLGTKSKTFMVNEAGIEAMVTPDGTVISAPTPGYGVIKNEYTERLTDFAADPLQFLNKEFSGYVGNYKNNQDSRQIININGNLSLPNVTNGESFVDSIKTLALQYTTRRR